jgi:hypothetical protein
VVNIDQTLQVSQRWFSTILQYPSLYLLLVIAPVVNMFLMDILPVHILLVDMLPSTTNTHKDMCDLGIREQVIRFLSRRDLDLQLMGMQGMS